jgi:hypothetical protein
VKSGIKEISLIEIVYFLEKLKELEFIPSSLLRLTEKGIY